MRAVLALLVMTAPAFAQGGAPVRNPCMATDGSGDLCDRAEALVLAMSAEAPRDLMPGVRLLSVTRGGAVMTLQVDVSGNPEPPLAGIVACADPRVAALVRVGMWVEIGGLSTDPLTTSTCEAP